MGDSERNKLLFQIARFMRTIHSKLSVGVSGCGWLFVLFVSVKPCCAPHPHPTPCDPRADQARGENGWDWGMLAHLLNFSKEIVYDFGYSISKCKEHLSGWSCKRQQKNEPKATKPRRTFSLFVLWSKRYSGEESGSSWSPDCLAVSLAHKRARVASSAATEEKSFAHRRRLISLSGKEYLHTALHIANQHLFGTCDFEIISIQDRPCGSILAPCGFS